MIHFLFGSYGSGKTESVLKSIKQDTEAGIRAFLIVPEQETVQSEHLILESLPPSAGITLEVLNFSRLYNRVCREYGGLCYRYVTKPIRHLLMWKNLRELAPLLEVYGNDVEDASLAEIMLSALDEMKACGIRPEELELAAKHSDADSSPLCARLRDLALIFSSFDRLLAENYTDSADDLSRLHDILRKERFFSDSHVYIDSFTSFTAMEHKIIERIFAQAKEVTVTVPLPSPDCRSISVRGVLRSLETLKRSASLHGGSKDTVLTHNHRARTSSLAFLSEHLWNMEISSEADKHPADGSVVAEICDTPYAEAEAASAHILELLRKGERCRSIVILMRNPETYRGIIEPALEKNGIPYFFSEKTDLCTLPPIKLLLSALRIKQYHWQKNDIISHLKTGMYDFPLRDIDLFEEYMDTWRIHGTRFTDGDFTMNPDGFAETVSPRGEQILLSANRVRRGLTEYLERFFILLDASETVADQCRAVYRYFSEIGLEERLIGMAQAESAKGNRKRAEEYRALFGVILNTLADVGTALSEESATTEEFLLILQTVFRQTDIGTIPTSIDEVTIGSAATLRASNPKFTLILGLCEGEFPASINDRGLFTSGDRQALSDMGLELSADADTRSSDELLFVQRAMASPSHGLYLFTSTAKADGSARLPSLPFHRLSALFSDFKPHRFVGGDLRYLAGSAQSAVPYLRMIRNTPEGASLARVLEERIPEVSLRTKADATISTCRIDPSRTQILPKDRVCFSSSRFESYVNCPFQYYCTYVLGLRKKQSPDFRASNIGTFVHYVLEQLIRYAVEYAEEGIFPSDELLIQKTEETVKEYVERVCPEELRESKRLSHLYRRLQRLSLLMVRNIVEEFSHSDFRPAFFELNTNGKDGNPAPMEFALEDGYRVSFSGIIDRVDVLKRDGAVYLRIVDYKTGTKEFSLNDVAHGINVQMLLYLFTLCRNPSDFFARSLGSEDGSTPTPAGILYLSANIPVIGAEDYDSEEAVMEKAAKALKRSGLLLSDEEILLAMNHQLSPDFLAGIKKDKDGALVGNALFDREDFQKLYESIRATVERITKEMRDGKADASPLQYGENDPCAHCEMKPICRRNEG